MGLEYAPYCTICGQRKTKNPDGICSQCRKFKWTKPCAVCGKAGRRMYDGICAACRFKLRPADKDGIGRAALREAIEYTKENLKILELREQGYSFAEISNIVGLSKTAVYMRMKKILPASGFQALKLDKLACDGGGIKIVDQLTGEIEYIPEPNAKRERNNAAEADDNANEEIII